MLGYVTSEGRGRIDDLLCTLAEDLSARGVRVAGAVQRNGPERKDAPCDMDLEILTGARTIRISQSLGALSRGCRLDPQGFEEAVGQVEASLQAAHPPDILIINKFGNQEAEGRGFRGAIGAALERGIPALIGVRAAHLEALTDWTGELAAPVDPEDLTQWCLKAVGTN